MGMPFLPESMPRYDRSPGCDEGYDQLHKGVKLYIRKTMAKGKREFVSMVDLFWCSTCGFTYSVDD